MRPETICPFSFTRKKNFASASGTDPFARNSIGFAPSMGFSVFSSTAPLPGNRRTGLAAYLRPANSTSTEATRFDLIIRSCTITRSGATTYPARSMGRSSLTYSETPRRCMLLQLGHMYGIEKPSSSSSSGALKRTSTVTVEAEWRATSSRTRANRSAGDSFLSSQKPAAASAATANMQNVFFIVFSLMVIGSIFNLK